MTCDSRSNILASTNALSQTTRFEYNHVLGDGTPSNEPTKDVRPATAETPPEGWENRYEYDSRGNLTKHIDGPVGGPQFGAHPLVEHAHNSRGLVTSSTDAEQRGTTFTYDPVTGFMLTRTIASGTPQQATWTTTRSELGWPMTERTPLGERTTLAYNVNGQVVSVTDPLGRILTKTYDEHDARTVARLWRQPSRVCRGPGVVTGARTYTGRLEAIPALLSRRTGSYSPFRTGPSIGCSS